MSQIDETLPSAVLDTHVLLDWLVFEDPVIASLVRAITKKQVLWLASPALREEHDLVVGRAEFARWRPDPARLAGAWARWARMLPHPEAAAPWRCGDADDQKFLDLAVACRARWLLTRDRALLKLARKARERGLLILTPESWTQQRAS